MQRFMYTLAMAILGLVPSIAQAVATDLFFSEYIEGSGNNKALEIYNGTGADVDLTNYSVQLFANGAVAATSTQTLSGTLLAGDVYVIRNSGAPDATIIAQADIISGVTNYNGDDAITLRNGANVIDVIGQVGFDPGTEWGVGVVSMQDNTLTRMSDVCAGDANPSDAFDPAPEWNGFAIDTVANLGSHTANCVAAALPTLTIANASIAEGSSGCVGGVTQLNFTVTADPAPASDLNFTFSTADDAVGLTPASAGNDYTAVADGTGTISATQTTGTATVNISCDLQVEENETFTVNMVDTADYDLGDPASATGTINNDDVATIVINDVSAPEGASNSIFSFTVSLADGVLAGTGGVDVDYDVIADAMGTHPASAPDDFTATSGTAHIGPNENSTTIDVTVIGDMDDDLADETFVVNLSNAVNATITDAQGLGTIENDDSTIPTLRIDSNVAVDENAGVATVTVSVSLVPTSDITVEISTVADANAEAGNDYQAISNQVLTFTPSSPGPQNIDIAIVNDTLVEDDETFSVVLSTPTGGSAIHPTLGSRTVTILNDDVQRTLNIAPGDLTINTNEGDSGTHTIDFHVELDGDAPVGGVTFNASTVGAGTDPADSSDYVVLTDAPFNIPQGQLSTTITVTINGDLSNEPDESFTLTLSDITGTNVVTGTIAATATITNDDTVLELEIHDIQGNAARSPLAPASGTALGTVVTTLDNIVTALAPNGFFIQTPDDRVDSDPQTSQGIFVFTSAAPAATIEVGDVVSVRGAVMEFFDFTQLSGTLVINEEASGAAPPTALELDHMTPSPDPAALSCGQTLGNFECYESQLVTVPAGVVVNGNLTFGTDPFAEVYVSSAGTRYRREEGVRFGLTGPLGVPVWDGNPEAFELDADKLLPANNGRAIIGGSLFSATGVIGYDFGGYELWPTQLDVIEETLPRQVPVATSNQLTVGSFNLFRLCATVSCDSPAPTGPEIAAKITRLSDYIRTTLRSPDVLGVQEVETIALLQQLATQIATDGGPTYTSYLVEGFDVGGIDVGFLVREDRVDVAQVRQLAETEVIDNPDGCSNGIAGCIKHDRPPLLLEGVYTANGANFPFAVMNNHTRSRGSLDTGPDTERVRLKRFAQGESIAQLVQRFQTGQELEPSEPPTGNTNTADVPLILVGDYNTFEVTDGWVDVLGLIAGTYVNADNELQLAGPNITSPPLVQGSASIPLEERYSYAFEENFGNIQGQAPRRVRSVQILDHGLINHIAQPSFSGMAYGRTNVDAPRYLETNGTDGIGISDHDGFVMYFNAAPLPDEVFSDGFEN